MGLEAHFVAQHGLIAYVFFFFFVPVYPFITQGSFFARADCKEFFFFVPVQSVLEVLESRLSRDVVVRLLKLVNLVSLGLDFDGNEAGMKERNAIS